MALIRLPIDVQSMLSASANVNSFKAAVEELVYNSIDAKSSSIAIRVNIPEGSIQVIDNGHGITKSNLQVLGQRHMTSKMTDKAKLKSAPDVYGYKGEFLANVISVAQQVKITSRYENGDETWSKAFADGKEKRIAKMSTRPSKGTTVEIKGFLYNLHIVKKGIDPTNEIQNIKCFLEQLSLVHHDISVSLRDDSKNDIIFKLPKKRDIYHTLSSLYNINDSCIQELSVEKSQYKVKAFIGKEANEYDKQWIYLNKRIVNNGKLHKIMNKYLKKYVPIKTQKLLKRRGKETDDINASTLPFYFLFVTCPYMDYDVSNTPKHSVLELKNWEQIDKLLQKLVQFYVSDNNLKASKLPKTEANDRNLNKDTRDQVQKMIKRILGSSSKGPETAALQKGVKGKNIKRKNTKNIKSIDVRQNLSKQKETKNLPKKCPKVEENDFKNMGSATKEFENLARPETDNDQEIYLKEDISCRNSNRKEFIANSNATRKNKKLNHKSHIKSKLISKNLKNHQLRNNKQKFYPEVLSNDPDIVSRRSKETAYVIKEFLQHDWKLKQAQKLDYLNKNKNQIFFQDHRNGKLYNQKLIPNDIKRYFYRRKPDFKTTYDLVKAITYSQQRNEITQQNSCTMLKSIKKNHFTEKHITQKDPAYSPLQKLSIDHEYRNFYPRQRLTQSDKKTPSNNKVNSAFQDFIISPNTFNIPQPNVGNIPIQSRLYPNDSHKYLLRYKTNALKGSKLTFESHPCYNNKEFTFNSKIQSHKTLNQHFRFITKQSRDNFNVPCEKLRPKHRRQFKSKNYTIYNNLKNKYYNIQMQQTIDTLSYSIQYSQSIEINNHSELIANSIHENSLNTNLPLPEPDITCHNQSVGLCDTYTLKSYHFSDSNIEPQNLTLTNDELKDIGTYVIEYADRGAESHIKAKPIENEKQAKDYNLNVMFVSKSQSTQGIQPLNICNAVISDSDVIEKSFGKSFENNHNNDSLYDNLDNNFNYEFHINAVPINTSEAEIENISHHFTNIINTENHFTQNDGQNLDKLLNASNENVILNHNTDCNDQLQYIESNKCDFNIEDRLRFLPKGMSQIFKNCQTKGSCNYELEKDYYENNIYNKFVNDVHAGTEVYEPLIQNVDDYTHVNINKFQNKLKTDNVSLVFDQKSLEGAQVLNQVDSKFIAAVVTEKQVDLRESMKYLVLFDQHAVSERIRLEENLSDYLKKDKWITATIEDVTLKLNKDEILYLHNHKEKFNQLGIHWNVVNENKITLDSIPQAILGKNPREVDKVIQAAKNMIVEEISYIRQQKGCTNLYPKSLMDLVNSEACRHAIMFGDKLSGNECKELLKSLSHCKAPFQCAHGRPVMAVLMEIIDEKEDKQEYKANIDNLLKFKANMANNRGK